MKRLGMLALPLLLAGCVATPPAHWANGGTALDVPNAHWVRGDGTVDVISDGTVLVNGEHELTVDRAGRVFDEDAQPIALLEPDGRLVGPEDVSLGVVGSQNASLPGQATAWLSVGENGEVVVFDGDGQRIGLGAWTGGCSASPRAHQVCTLVSHLIAMRMQGRLRPSTTMSGEVRFGRMR